MNQEEGELIAVDYGLNQLLSGLSRCRVLCDADPTVVGTGQGVWQHRVLACGDHNGGRKS
jgi:hypothetical protein